MYISDFQNEIDGVERAPVLRNEFARASPPSVLLVSLHLLTFTLLMLGHTPLFGDALLSLPPLLALLPAIRSGDVDAVKAVLLAHALSPTMLPSAVMWVAMREAIDLCGAGADYQAPFEVPVRDVLRMVQLLSFYGGREAPADIAYASHRDYSHIETMLIPSACCRYGARFPDERHSSHHASQGRASVGHRKL